MLKGCHVEGHGLAHDVLAWRGLAKLKSTYTDALPEFINPETGRVHTSYSLAATTTGRLASSDPNLQNIPIRTARRATHPHRLCRPARPGAGQCRLQPD